MRVGFRFSGGRSCVGSGTANGDGGLKTAATDSTISATARGWLRVLTQNLVAGFGGCCWGCGEAVRQERGVEGYYGDDNIGDHYWFGADEDAIGQPDDGAEGLHDAERLVIAE